MEALVYTLWLPSLRITMHQMKWLQDRIILVWTNIYDDDNASTRFNKCQQLKVITSHHALTPYSTSPKQDKIT